MPQKTRIIEYLDEYIELEELKKGSMPAFECLYNRYSSRLYGFIMHISMGNKYMSEEIVQQTFIKIWEKREMIDVSKSFLNFLCTIAKNLLLNNYQRELLGYVYEEYIQNLKEETDNSTEQEIELNLLERYLDSVIQQLPPARREIFILSKKKDYSNKMIAAKLGISESTIEKQLSKAIQFVREKLQQHSDMIFLAVLYCGILLLF